MPHKYQLTVQPIESVGGSSSGNALSFEVSNHDDLFEIVARMQGRQLLPEDEVVPFIVGLKLFTEVLVRHRHELMFDDLWEAMGRFMKRLKSQAPSEPAGR